MKLNKKIIEIINNLQEIENKTDFDNFISFFISNDKENVDLRLVYYEKIKLKQNLSSLADAKKLILKKCLSNYIYKEINLANQISLPLENSKNINHNITNIIDSISKINKLFKSHDIINFEDFILSSVEDMNLYEFKAIFNKYLDENNDFLKLNNLEKNILKEENFNIKTNLISNKNKEYVNNFLSHPFINLYKAVDRNINNNFIGDSFLNKYKNLAINLQKIRASENKEKFRGAVSYLIHLDITKGLNKIKEPKELKKILDNLKNEKLCQQAFNDLCSYSSINSKNFIINKDGDISYIENHNATKNIGPVDRVYDNLLFFDKSNEQNEQLSRTISILSKNNIKKENSNYIPLQLASNFSIDKKLNNYSSLRNDFLNDNERMILSYAQNYSSFLSFISNKQISIEQLMTPPIELYNENLEESIDFNKKIQLYETPELQILNYTHSFLNIVENKKLLSLLSTNYENNLLNQIITTPAIKLFSSLNKLIEQNIIKENEQINDLINSLGDCLVNYENNIVNNNNIILPDNVLNFFNDNKYWEKYKNNKKIIQKLIPLSDLLKIQNNEIFEETINQITTEKQLDKLIDNNFFNHCSFLNTDNNCYTLDYPIIKDLQKFNKNKKMQILFKKIITNDLQKYKSNNNKTIENFNTIIDFIYKSKNKQININEIENLTINFKSNIKNNPYYICILDKILNFSNKKLLLNKENKNTKNIVKVKIK